MKLPGDGSHLYTNPNICIMLRACECLFDNNIWLAHFWFRHFQIRMNYGHYNKRCKNPTSVLSESSNAVKIVGENECVYFQLESWHKPKIIHRLEFNWRLEAHGVALIEHIHCEIEGNIWAGFVAYSRILIFGFSSFIRYSGIFLSVFRVCYITHHFLSDLKWQPIFWIDKSVGINWLSHLHDESMNRFDCYSIWFVFKELETMEIIELNW